MFRQATVKDIVRLQKILVEAWKTTYAGLYSEAYIHNVIEIYYNLDRLRQETTVFSKAWSGYYVWENDGNIVGCIGGGIDGAGVGEIYVFYLDPQEKRKGYGRLLLDAFTSIQKQDYSIKKQVVAVTKGNRMGIPFYERMGFVDEGIRIPAMPVMNEHEYSLVMSRDV